MKLAFAHDHVFKEDQAGNLYTGSSYNNEIWKRYLKHFDQVTVLARVEELEKEEDHQYYNPFNLRRTKLVPVPSLSGPLKQFSNRSEAEIRIGNVIADSDVLIARLPSEIGNLAIEVARRLGKYYVVEVVSCVRDALLNYGTRQAQVYAPMAMHRMQKSVLDAPLALYVTEAFLQERYPTNGKAVTVANVEIPRVFEESLELRSNRLFDADHPPYQIGMIGNLNKPSKGWEVALRALGELAEKKIDFEFNILGDGEIEKWTALAEELKIAEKVKFSGVLPDGELVLKWLDDQDLYIQPSLQDVLPRALIEAMSRGCPVAGSDAGEIPQLLDSSCIHQAGDFSALAASIEKMMTDREYALSLTEMNLETAQQYIKPELDKKREAFFNNLFADYRMVSGEHVLKDLLNPDRFVIKRHKKKLTKSEQLSMLVSEMISEESDDLISEENYELASDEI